MIEVIDTMKSINSRYIITLNDNFLKKKKHKQQKNSNKKTHLDSILLFYDILQTSIGILSINDNFEATF